MSGMKSLLILGAGGHGVVVKEVAEACGYDKIDFLDDNFPHAIGKISELENFKEYKSVFVSIGNNTIRKQLLDKACELGYDTPALIHPDAYISSSANIHEGTIVEPKAIINSNVEIGRGCIVSIGAVIDHNACIDEFAHINAGTAVKSAAHVGPFRRLEVGEIVQ